jgi:FkbM family methyltransferase
VNNLSFINKSYIMNSLRRLLFSILGLDRYLTLMRKMYFLLFTRGLLRGNRIYEWHYFVRHLIREGDIIIDIGANMGYYSYIFAGLTGDRGQVYSVEPVMPLRRQLARQLKGRPNVTIIPFALGNEAKAHIVLTVPDSYRDLGYLRHGLLSVTDDDQAGDRKYTFDASLCRGSQVFAALYRIDYIKCDIEGHEATVLQELGPLLKSHMPMVQVEIWNAEFEMLVDFFRQLGYAAFKLNRQALVPLEVLPCGEQTILDTLFVPPRHLARVQPFIAA